MASPADFARATPGASGSRFDPEALTRALRIAGAVLVVASASTFLLQHWQAGNDLLRYALLVGQSSLLAAVAYFVGLTVRESRSARTLLALVLASLPACFTVLGALVYSRFHLEALAPMPAYASWVAPSDAAALLAVGASLLVLAPLSLVAFVALARPQARLLTLVFLGSNALLLLPVRTPETVALLAGAASIGLLQLDQLRLSRAPRLDTLEGRLARLMSFVPPVILLGRVVHLYDMRASFVGVVLLIGAALLWQLLPRWRAGFRDLGSLVAAIAAELGWGLCWLELLRHVSGPSLSILLLGLPAAALLLIASLRADSVRKALSGAATLLGLGTTLVACLAGPSTASALICIACGTLVAVAGAAVRERVWMLAGSVVGLFGVASAVWLAMQADQLTRWASLSIAGVLLIVVAAYVERHRAGVAAAWGRLTEDKLPTTGDDAPATEIGSRYG